MKVKGLTLRKSKSTAAAAALSALVLLTSADLRAGTAYSLSGSDTDVNSSFNGTGDYGWNNDRTHVPSSGNTYRVDGFAIRTPASGNIDFAGDSLTLGDGATLQSKYTSSGTLTVPNLIIDGGSATFLQGSWNATCTVDGNCVISNGATLNVSVAISSTVTGARNWNIRSAVSGTGGLALVANANSANGSTITMHNLGGFAGRISVAGVPNGSSHCASFVFNAYPADPAVASADAFSCAGGRLKFMSDGVFGANRGFTFDKFDGAVPVIYVESGKTVTIDGPIAGVGFEKIGGGNLTLTAASEDFAGEITVGEGTLSLESAAGTLWRKCRETGGELKLASDIAYVNPAQEGNIPPFDTPDNAVQTLDDAVACLKPGGRIVLASGNYDLTGESVATADCGFSFALTGPEDRSAVLSGELKVRPGQVWSSVTYDGASQLSVLAGAVVSNMTVRGGGCPVWLQGSMAGCLLTGMTGSAAVHAVPASGGSHCELRDTVISNCNFTGEVLDGGQYARAPILITPNGSSGGEVFLLLRGCSVVDNISAEVAVDEHLGAGVFMATVSCDGSKIVADRCRFTGNKGRNGVARIGAYNMATTFFATNCLFAANESLNAGQALFWGSANFVNCTLCSNTASGVILSKGALMPNSQTCRIKNSIFSGNIVSDVTFKKADDQVVFAIDHTVFPEATAADGNLAGPAKFTTRSGIEYLLRRRTPGADAGDASIWGAKDLDLAGNRRMSGENKVDMGCFQWKSLGLAVLLY